MPGQVLEEVKKGPPHDERRTFRRSIMFSVMIVCVLYVMTNVAFVSAGFLVGMIPPLIRGIEQFTTCTKDEIKNSPETLTLFFEKVLQFLSLCHVRFTALVLWSLEARSYRIFGCTVPICVRCNHVPYICLHKRRVIVPLMSELALN